MTKESKYLQYFKLKLLYFNIDKYLFISIFNTAI